jgi:hypothetical protein
MTFYIYQHRKADTNEIFYVGKGKGTRLNQSKGRNQYWHRVVAKHGFVAEFIAQNLDEELAFLAEIEAIDVYKRRGIKLVNHTNGGEGVSNPSDEVRQKMSLAKIGKPSPRKGIVLSNQQKEKLSISGKQKPKRALRKLTLEQVKEIRLLQGVLSNRKIAEKFGVTQNVIFGILHNKTYIQE